MKFIVGTKSSMTQVFDDNGVCHPATVLRVDPMVVTQLRKQSPDGYEAVQVATGAQKEHRVGKAQKVQQQGAYSITKEFRPRKNYQESVVDFSVGQKIDAGVFTPGDKVVVSSISKGKGFQGGVKRHGFKGGRATHGQKHSEREPGSIGATGPGRVFKGTRMAGRMGSDRKTVKNLRVLQVDLDSNLLLISGAVPGRRGSVVTVRNI